MNDLTLFDTPPSGAVLGPRRAPARARATDPQTSRDAAASLTPEALGREQGRVLRAISMHAGYAVDTLGPPDGLKLTDQGRAALYGTCPVCARPLGPEPHTDHHPACPNRQHPATVDCTCPDVHPACCTTEEARCG